MDLAKINTKNRKNGGGDPDSRNRGGPLLNGFRNSKYQEQEGRAHQRTGTKSPYLSLRDDLDTLKRPLIREDLNVIQISVQGG